MSRKPIDRAGRTRLERIFQTTAPDELPPVDEDALAERRQEKAEETAANLYENLHAELMRTRHERDEALVAVELLTEENEGLRRRIVEMDEGRSLSTALQVYRRMVEQDKTDQPPPDLMVAFCNGCGKEITAGRFADHGGLCADCDPNGRPDLTVWVDVVEPSKNGTQ